jgi:hypothetical protein
MTGRGLLTSDELVFFVPAWERQWYLALASSAVARDARDARIGAECWGDAERRWGDYIGRSTASGRHDPFLPIARARRDRAHAARVDAEKRAVSTKTPGPPPIERACRGD